MHAEFVGGIGAVQAKAFAPLAKGFAGHGINFMRVAPLMTRSRIGPCPSVLIAS